MKRFLNKEFKAYTYFIEMGERLATDEKNVYIATTLGSCVSVCLMDMERGIYGMNHFLIPGKFTDDFYINPECKNGTHAMDRLINDMMFFGTNRKRLVAKIFGGANMILKDSNINNDNISLARAYLELEGIPILSEDVGGTSSRTIYFSTADGSVLVKKVLHRENNEKIFTGEKGYRPDVGKLKGLKFIFEKERV